MSLRKGFMISLVLSLVGGGLWFLISFFLHSTIKNIALAESLSLFSLVMIISMLRVVEEWLDTFPCPRCEQLNSKGAHFCNICGIEFSRARVVEREDMIRCQECGQLNRENWAFCAGCGHPLQKRN